MDPSLHPASLPLERLDRTARVRLVRAGWIRTVGTRRPLQLDGAASGVLLVVDGAVALRVGTRSGSVAVTSVLFFDGVGKIFPFVYASR